MYPGEVTPPTMFSRIREQAHKGYWHEHFTDVLSLFSRSCIIIMMRSGCAMGQAWFSYCNSVRFPINPQKCRLNLILTKPCILLKGTVTLRIIFCTEKVQKSTPTLTPEFLDRCISVSNAHNDHPKACTGSTLGQILREFLGVGCCAPMSRRPHPPSTLCALEKRRSTAASLACDPSWAMCACL